MNNREISKFHQWSEIQVLMVNQKLIYHLILMNKILLAAEISLIGFITFIFLRFTVWIKEGYQTYETNEAFRL